VLYITLASPTIHYSVAKNPTITITASTINMPSQHLPQPQHITVPKNVTFLLPSQSNNTNSTRATTPIHPSSPPAPEPQSARPTPRRISTNTFDTFVPVNKLSSMDKLDKKAQKKMIKEKVKKILKKGTEVGRKEVKGLVRRLTVKSEGW
jgi:hypothetical protein